MAAFTLTNSEVLVGGFDLTQFTGQYTVGGTVAMQEANVHGGGGFRRVYPGLKSFTTSISGFADFDAGAVSRAITPTSVGSQVPVTIVPIDTATAGDTALFTRGLIADVDATGGAIGEMATFSANVGSDAPLVGGIIGAPLAARTSTFTGPVLAMTGPTATQSLYANLHVVAASGTTPSMTVTIQSATLVGFGSPTTRATFTAVTGQASQWFGSNVTTTDGFWRVVMTITGTTPSFTAACAFGVA